MNKLTPCILLAGLAAFGLAACDNEPDAVENATTNGQTTSSTTDNRPAAAPNQPAATPERAPTPARDSAADGARRDAASESRNAPTAADQGASEADMAITREIRRAVVQNEAMSIAAQNITIVTENGRVTLVGSVRNDAERETIADIARRVPGVTEVDNQLEVAPGSQPGGINPGR